MIGAAGAPEPTGLCTEFCELGSELNCDYMDAEQCRYGCELEGELSSAYGCAVEWEQSLECTVAGGADAVECGVYGVEQRDDACLLEAYYYYVCLYYAVYGS
jgi:hypothetical protein